jgi:hypothetical protein
VTIVEASPGRIPKNQVTTITGTRTMALAPPPNVLLKKSNVATTPKNTKAEAINRH